jgi:hypothetical protein
MGKTQHKNIEDLIKTRKGVQIYDLWGKDQHTYQNLEVSTLSFSLF